MLYDSFFRKKSTDTYRTEANYQDNNYLYTIEEISLRVSEDETQPDVTSQYFQLELKMLR